MSQMRYDLVILRHNSEKRVEDLVQDLLKLLNKANDPYLEYKLSEALLFEQNNNAVLDDIDEEQGRHFQEEFRKLQVETELRPTLQLVSKEDKTDAEPDPVYTCPACGHEQPRQKGDAMNTCDQCGVVGEKFERIKKREKVYQSEKRKLEQSQASEMKEALQRAKYEEEETLRNEARERLGIKKKNNIVNALVGVAAVSAMGVAAFFITNALRSGEVPDASPEAEVAERTPKENQPLITIQGGSGSIVVNNNSPEGSSGPEGSTTDSSDSSSAAPQSENTLASSHAPVEGMDQTVGAAESGAMVTTSSDAPQQNSASQQTALAQASSQLADGRTQLSQNGVQQLAAINNTSSDITRQTSLSANQPNPVVLLPKNLPIEVSEQSAEQELVLLQSILEPNNVVYSTLFPATSPEQFTEYDEQLGRLLKLGKTELAIVFAETVDNPYTASQLLVKIAKHGKQQQQTEYNNDLLFATKNLEQTGDHKWLIANNYAQIQALAGDPEMAQQALINSLQKLQADQNITVLQRVSTLVQMVLDRSAPPTTNDDVVLILAELNAYTQSLPKEEHMAMGRAYTLMAHVAFAEDNFGAAKKWLQHVPALDARGELLRQLNEMKIKLITKMQQEKT